MKRRQPARVAGGAIFVAGALATLAPAARAQAHVPLPPVNLGNSSFMDGLGGPGFLARVPWTLQIAPRFFGSSGQTLAGANSLVAWSVLVHALYSPPVRVLGGYWAIEVLEPLAIVDMTMPGGKASAAGAGDVIFSPLIFQAPKVRLFGRPLLQRLDIDFIAPTGEYRRDAPINVGNHVWSLNPYYAFTWLLSDRFETSWRFHYLWNSVNDAPGPQYAAKTIQPGQAVHFNWALSVEVSGPLRAGIAGYFLQQISDSRIDGRAIAGSRERVAAVGPGLLALTGTTELYANAFAELAVENRPAGARFDVCAQHVW